MHRYGLARGFLLNLSVSPLRLALLLWQQGSSLGLEDKLPQPGWQLVPQLLLKTYRVARLSLALAFYQSGRGVLELPGYGQLGLALRLGGYKLFDLAASSVLTLFSEDLPAELVSTQIAKAEQAGRHPFAPAVTASNVGERWYKEPYLLGRRLPPLESQPSLLTTHFFPLFLDLIKAEPAQSLELQQYARQLQDFALGEARGLAHPALYSRLNLEQAQRLTAFFETTVAGLQQEGQVYLVLSHGDLHEHNVLDTLQGLRLIDWNNLGYRSLGYDLYTLLFRTYQPVRAFWSRQHRPPQPQAIAVAAADFERAVAVHLPAFAGQLSKKTSRQLFYLEFLCKGIDKFWENPTPEAAHHRLEHLRAWTTTFARYEAGQKN